MTSILSSGRSDASFKQSPCTTRFNRYGPSRSRSEQSNIWRSSIIRGCQRHLSRHLISRDRLQSGLESSLISALPVSNACGFAQEFHSLNNRSTCHRGRSRADVPGRKLVVKRLVRHRGAEQRRELPVNVGQCLDPPHRVTRQETPHQPMGSNQALPMAESAPASEVDDVLRRQHALDLIGEWGDSAASHPSFPGHESSTIP